MAGKEKQKKKKAAKGRMGRNAELLSRTSKPGGRLDSAQRSIPYVRVYDLQDGREGIIETHGGRFTKCWTIESANYSNVGDEKQDEILREFENILNLFDHRYSYEITVSNRSIDKEAYSRSIMLELMDDGLDDLRLEHNRMLLDRMQDGKNNIRSEVYLTVGVEAGDVREADRIFSSIENDINIHFKRINQTGMRVQSLAQRLEILHDIYNLGTEGEFSRTFDIRALAAQGLTTKDAIAPMSFEVVRNDCIRLGGIYARSLTLSSVPASLSGTLLESLTSLAANVLVSVHYQSYDQEAAVSYASEKVTAIGGDVAKAQRTLTKGGMSPELISPKLETAQRDARQMLDDITNRNQRLFQVTVVATVFAENEEDLDMYTSQIKTQARAHVCSVEILRTQQEQAFNTALPLAENLLDAHRVMTSETASVLQPMSTEEINQKGGIYYGQNQRSRNLLILNQEKNLNQNTVIFGAPGSGKSMMAKSVLYQVALGIPNAQIFVIDPQREYLSLSRRLKGQEFAIRPGGEVSINPFDLDLSEDPEGESRDALAEKVDYIISVVECMLGGKQELTGSAKSIVDETLKGLYAPYIEALSAGGRTIDTAACPTLLDFHNALRARREGEARQLADSIRIYCTGTLDLFAKHTNINTDAKIVVYDVSAITGGSAGSNLQELGMQICMNDIWNRMIANRKRGIRTFFYVDEAHLFLHMPSSAAYLEMVWKMARKWWGAPTFLTQEVKDMINSPEGTSILETSSVAIMLSQARFDRSALADIYDISPEQQQYFTNVGAGEGLIYTGHSVIPFVNRFPTDTELYGCMTTKPSETVANRKNSQ